MALDWRYICHINSRIKTSMMWRSPGLRGITILTGGLLLSLNSCTDPSSPDLSDGPARLESTKEEAGPRFVDVARATGLIHTNVSGTAEQRYMAESASAGSGFLDYDSDGFLDLFLVNGTRSGATAVNLLYRNVPGDSTHTRSFAAVDADFGPPGWGMGCAAGDIDNDGDPEIYVTYLGPNRLHANEGGDEFPEVAAALGVDDNGWGASAAFGDLDADGYLDLYVTNYVEFDIDNPERHRVDCPYKGLPVFCGPGGFDPQPDRVYRNRGGGFEDMSGLAGVADHAYPGLGVILSDLDVDGDLDIYVANDTAPNLLFRNDGDWRFEEMGLRAAVAFSGDGRDQAGMGVHSADFDNDGLPDLFVTNFSDDVNTLYHNESGGGVVQFTDATYQAGLGGSAMPYLGWGAGFFDYDNDGWLDLYVTNGHLYPQLNRYEHGLQYAQRNLLYNNRGGRFTEVSAGAWDVEKVSRSASVGDYDNDGDPDLLITNLNDRPSLLRNDGGINHWLGLDLVGTESNRDGIGTRVAVFAAGLRLVREVQRSHGFQAAHDKRLLIGLGTIDTIDRVEIRWPSGRLETLDRPPPGRYLKVVEGEGGWTLAATAAPASGAIGPGGGGIREPAPKTATKLPAEVSSWSTEEIASTTSRLFNEARYDEVKAILEIGLDRDPRSVQLRFLLGQVLVMGLGEYEAAVEQLERAVRDYPTAVDAHFYLGRAYLRSNRLPDAMRAFRRASELVPSNWEYLHELGQAYMRSDSLDAAAAVLLQAAELAPWEPGPHLQLVEVFRGLSREEEAREHQEQFSALFPRQELVKKLEKKSNAHSRDAGVRRELGAAYMRQDRLEEALDQFNKAVMLDPQDAAAFAGIGSVMFAVGQFEEAIRAWEASLQKHPEQPAIRDSIDQAKKRLGR